MNYSNLAQKTNYVAGSTALNMLPFYLTSVNIPGLNLSHPEVGGRDGAKLNLTGDTLTFNALSFEMLVDEDFQIYHEFMDKVLKNVEPETGVFQNEEFDFWIEINNNKGNKLFKVEFYNCRIESIGDIQLDTQDDATEHTMSTEIKYDYFKTIRGTQTVPVLSV